MKKYNPYNSMKKIVDLKNSYDNEKRLNGNYKQYQDEAVQYYNDLISNGYVQQAADLSKYGYEDALNYLNNSGWKSDEETAFDEWYDNIGKVSADGTNEETELDKWVNNIGKVSTGDKRTVSEQQSSYIDKLMGIGTGETQVTPTQAATDLLDMVKSNDAIYNDSYTQFQNNVMSGANDLLNYDYTQQSFYQPIMDSYNLFGENAANGALASGASGNAGNIDSYAAANAARQQLAFTNAGHQAALAAAAQNQGGWLDAFRLSKDALGDLRLKNADIGNIYTHQVTTDANERQAANDVIRQLFGDESAERTNATNAMVDKYLADLGLVQTQYVTDSDERMNTANNEHDLAVQRLANEYGLTVAQMESVLEDTKARLQYDSALAGYEADKYSADKTYDAAKYKADMEKTLKELEIQDTPTAEQSNTVTEAHANGVQELYSVLSEFINALRGGQYEDIQSVDDIRREIKNWSGYSTAYDPIIQSYLNGYERKFGTTT